MILTRTEWAVWASEVRRQKLLRVIKFRKVMVRLVASSPQSTPENRKP